MQSHGGCAVSGGDGPRRGDVAAASLGVGLESVFQPIVSLPDENIVGFEALARWPHLGDLDPSVVFAHAGAAGWLARLDQLCIHSAINGALAASVGRDTWVFVNIEPTTPYIGRAKDELLARAHDELQLIFEVTERRLLTHPDALLKKVAALRADGFAVALDDIDTNADSLTLLDVVAPDVVKLDLKLVQSQPRYDRLRTWGAILDYQQRTGALLLAEGIETAQHLQQALSMGAVLGQGFRFGLPRRLDRERPAGVIGAPRLSRQQLVADSSTPFEVLVAAGVEARTESKDTLVALSRYLESQAANATHPPIVLAAVQRAEQFTTATRRRYEELAVKCPLVAVFGRGLPQELGSGIRGIALDPFDPLCAQWIVVTLGPGLTAALIARERPEHLTGRTRDGDRRFDLAFTNDRAQVAAAVRHLLRRVH